LLSLLKTTLKQVKIITSSQSVALLFFLFFYGWDPPTSSSRHSATVYGLEIIMGPACNVSNISLIDLMPTKTFSRDDLETIKKLG
jgi:hypothetical protein